MADSPDSLSAWVIGAVATGGVTLLGVLSRVVAGSVVGRLDKAEAMAEERHKETMARLAEMGRTTADHHTKLELGAQSFAHMRQALARQDEEIQALRRRIHQLHESLLSGRDEVEE